MPQDADGHLAYCRWREPAFLLHSGVGAARGRRSFRGAGGVRADRQVGASVNVAGARLSVVVDQPWRASALAEMIREAGLVPEIGRTDEDTPLVRTAVDASLTRMAAEWTRGAVKTVPPRWLPGPRELRAWTLAAGNPEGEHYLLALDPARAGHPLAAGVGSDERRDRAHPDRHPRRSAGAADQRAPQAIAPGRERGGAARRRRGVIAVAASLARRRRPKSCRLSAVFANVSLRRPAQGCEIVRCRRAKERSRT